MRTPSNRTIWTLAATFLSLALLAVLMNGCSAVSSEKGVGRTRARMSTGAAPPLRGELNPSAVPRAAARALESEKDGQTPGIDSLVPPQSLPSPDEELWVIQKPEQPVAADASDELPGTGSLVAKRTPDATPDQMVPVPLKHTDVKASVAGHIATVDVTQQFHNPYDGKIEAVYVFPLPGNAAVDEFVMTVGERKIRGIIREREEAQRIYAEARNTGHVAALLTQERPNV